MTKWSKRSRITPFLAAVTDESNIRRSGQLPGYRPWRRRSRGFVARAADWAMELVEIRRCPVKSMQGEMPMEVTLDATGVVGDRAYALVDTDTGAVASAKDPRRWAGLLGFGARFSAEPGPGQPVTITLPGGAEVSSGQADVDVRLSAAVGRAVTLSPVPSAGAVYDEV